MISVELMGGTRKWFDPELVQDAAKAVFHYFKFEKGRQSVTVAEFAEALEGVLTKFADGAEKSAQEKSLGVAESDLARLAREAGNACELVFYPKLRAELRSHAQKSPRVVRFSGLRDCVKQLVGTERWGAKCRDLEEQIVNYLRHCATTELHSKECALLIH
jgi:hypothetical protein